MSHTLRKVNLGNTALVQATIVDYPAGGEAFTLAELGLAGGIASVSFICSTTFPISPASLLQITPSFQGNKIVLTQQVSPLNEQPPTVGINYSFLAFVVGT